MAKKNYSTTKLSDNEALKHLRLLWQRGVRLIVTNHQRERMVERDILLVDVENVLGSLSIRVSYGEEKYGRHSYRVETKRMRIFIGFDDAGIKIILISVMRK